MPAQLWGQKNRDITPDTDIIIAGIVWQLAETGVFSIVVEIVIFRARYLIWRIVYLVRLFAATMLTTTCMVVRGVYRSMEMIGGWRGYLFTTERFTIVLDTVMMFLALVLFNVWNRVYLVKQAQMYVEELDGGECGLPGGRK